MPSIRTVLAACLLSVTLAGQTTLGVPIPYPTIQAAINVAAPGDLVLVQPGNHVGPIDFVGKAVTVRSVAGPAVTTIDAANGGPVVSFITSETNASVLDGFTLSHGLGLAAGAAGGVEIIGSSPVIRRCVITACVGAPGAGAAGSGGTGGPGGLRLSASGARLEQLLITGNIGGTGGPAVACGSFGFAVGGTGGPGGILITAPVGALVFDRVEVTGNLGGLGGWSFCVTATGTSGTGGTGGAGGIDLYATTGQSLTLKRCEIIGNIGGGGMASSGQSGGNGGAGGFGGQSSASFFGLPGLNFENATVVANVGGPASGQGLGGSGGISALGVTLVVRSTTVAANTAGPGGSAVSGGLDYGGNMASSAQLSHSIFFGNTGTMGPSDLLGVGIVAFATNCNVGSHNGLAGSGNSSADPLFVSPSTGDFHLSAASPCRDSGSASGSFPAFDRDGDPRVVGPVIDRGSDEYDALTGTREDLVLSLAVAGVVPGSIPVVMASAGQIVDLRLSSPGGSFASNPVYLAAETWLQPFAPFSPPGFPTIHFSGAVALLAGLPGLGANGVTFSAPVPAGLGGLAIRFQAFAPLAGGANGVFAASAARDLLF